ncbi:Ptp1 [Kluyveromyces lactis]|nr:Ptp1 [Kluyveromyces lactis]
MGLLKTSDRMSRPKYLDQDDRDLLLKFRYIRQQEDARIRDGALHPRDSEWTFGVSDAKYNMTRNRYTNIKTYEKTRIKLKVVQGNDYINASDIRLQIEGQSKAPSHFIACQGPLPNTWPQFWQMVYQQCPEEGISVVMVTPLVEQGREKCYAYWPRSLNETMVSPAIQKTGPSPEDVSHFAFGLELENVLTQNCQHYTVSKILLKPSDPSFPVKTVNHFYYDQWSDMERPEEIGPLHHLMKHVHTSSDPLNPIFVHCSAGVGRSGTYMALDHLITKTIDFKDDEFIHSYDKDLIEQIVRQLRTQRLKTVESPQQYLFIYHAAKQIFRYTRGL